MRRQHLMLYWRRNLLDSQLLVSFPRNFVILAWLGLSNRSCACKYWPYLLDIMRQGRGPVCLTTVQVAVGTTLRAWYATCTVFVLVPCEDWSMDTSLMNAHGSGSRKCLREWRSSLFFSKIYSTWFDSILLLTYSIDHSGSLKQKWFKFSWF